MPLHTLLRPALVVAAILILLPLFSAGCAQARFATLGQRLPKGFRLAGPALLSVPYALVAVDFGIFRWQWLVLYALSPVAIAVSLDRARIADPEGRGGWRDLMVLAALGLAVDLRWLEPAWPPGLSAFGKMLLLDAGIYGFLTMRQLDGVGFDLRLTWKDCGVGLREFIFYVPLAILLGLGLGFIRFHAVWPEPLRAVGAFVFTFLCIALPEELFFRGWLQNLLERRVGRRAALFVTAIVFGLAHWNKRATGFNWRYVLLAALAGIFYGRAWRDQRRVGASSLTHASVDTLWSLWFR